MADTTIKVIFYKAEGQFMDKLIRWYTKSKYSHCELLFDDGRIFSSDGWNANGVRYSTNYNLDNWDVVTIPIREEMLKHLKGWCDSTVGQGYDWTGVIRFVLPFVPQKDDKWFCSELCGEALRYVGLLPWEINYHGLSPQGLFEEVTRRYDRSKYT